MFKSFVSEKTLEDAKASKQKQWEATRGENDPLERPEEVYDPRPLYERLQEQKMKKQEEYDQKHMFKNQIYKGLDEDEYDYLDELSKKQMDEEDKRWEEEGKEIKEFRQMQELAAKPAVSITLDSITPKPPKKVPEKKEKNTLSLIAGAIKRKNAGAQEPASKKDKSAEDTPEEKSEEMAPSVPAVTAPAAGPPSSTTATLTASTTTPAPTTGLLGLADYGSDSDSS